MRWDPKGAGMIAVSEPVVTALTRMYIETQPIGIAVWVFVSVIASALELVGALRRRPEATKKDRGSFIVLRICIIPGVVLLGLSVKFVPAAEIRPPLGAAIAGIVIFSAGESLRVWSRITLGRYFTYQVMTSKDQPVITSGPYRILRHPSYAGLLLMVIGVGAAFGNWLGLAALTLATLLGLSYRIYVEEKALLEELGDNYHTYAEHHKRLIPFVW
jgi:protein-S-isoprenylcysteine O-methyltransferase Ste14